MLDTAQFYDRAERLLNSKSNRSPRKKFSNTERNRPTRRNGYTKKNSYANSSSSATQKHIGAPSRKCLGGAMYVTAWVI